MGKGTSLILSSISTTGRKRFKSGKVSVFSSTLREIKENGYDLSISRYKEIEYVRKYSYKNQKSIIQKIENLEDPAMH